MSPQAGEGGGHPQGLSLCSLGGRRGSGLRKQPHARGSCLDVHTELFVYVGALLGPKKKSIRTPAAPAESKEKATFKFSDNSKERRMEDQGKKISQVGDVFIYLVFVVIVCLVVCQLCN